MLKSFNLPTEISVSLSLSFFFIALISFVGCGGGGGGGSSTKSSAGAAPSQYAGTYKGTSTRTVYFEDKSATDETPVLVMIDNNGYLDVAILTDTSDVTCTGGKSTPVQLFDSSFSYYEKSTCTVDYGPTCAATEEAIGNIDGNVMSGTIHIIYNCDNGLSFYSDANFSLNKQ